MGGSIQFDFDRFLRIDATSSNANDQYRPVRAVRNVVLIFADADLFDHLVPADDIGLDAGHEFLRRAADRFYTALKTAP